MKMFSTNKKHASHVIENENVRVVEGKSQHNHSFSMYLNFKLLPKSHCIINRSSEKRSGEALSGFCLCYFHPTYIYALHDQKIIIV